MSLVSELLGEKLTAHLKKIEKWEAKLILMLECWQDELPRLNQELLDEWMELQAERNKLLGRF
jgi:hypothetical protein